MRACVYGVGACVYGNPMILVSAQVPLVLGLGTGLDNINPSMSKSSAQVESHHRSAVDYQTKFQLKIG